MNMINSNEIKNRLLPCPICRAKPQVLDYGMNFYKIKCKYSFRDSMELPILEGLDFSIETWNRLVQEKEKELDGEL